MAELHRRTLGTIFIIEVDANPNGNISAPKGSVAFDKSSAKLYMNSDGNTSWSLIGG